MVLVNAYGETIARLEEDDEGYFHLAEEGLAELRSTLFCEGDEFVVERD